MLCYVCMYVCMCVFTYIYICGHVPYMRFRQDYCNTKLVFAWAFLGIHKTFKSQRGRPYVIPLLLMWRLTGLTRTLRSRHYTQEGVSIHGGVPINHPFLDGIFPNKNHPFWGTTMTIETPIYPSIHSI